MSTPSVRIRRPAISVAFVMTVFLVLLFDPGAVSAARKQDLDAEVSARFEEALAEISEQSYDVAVIRLKNLLQDIPDHIPARILLGKAYLRQGQGAAAESEFRRALFYGADKDNINVPLGNALLLQRKYQQLLTDIRSSALRSDANFEVQTLRGRAYYELGELDEAAAHFDLAIELAPDQINPLLGRANVAAARGNSDEALDYISRAIDLDANSAEPWYQRAEILRGREDYTAALEAYSNALNNNEKHVRARIGRASLAFFLGDVPTAYADASYVNEHAENNVTSSFILWQALLRMGQTEEAAAAFTATADRVAQLTDDALNEQPSLLRIAGLIAFAKQDYERAQRRLSKLLTVNPHDDAVRKLMGEIQLKLGDSQAARLTLAPLSRKYPHDAEVLGLLGQAYMEQRNFVEAADVLERASTQLPGNQIIKNKLVLSRIGAGHVDKAIGDLKQMVDSDSISTSSGILLTTLHLKREQYADAIETAQRLVELHPDNPVIMNLIGTVMLKTGQRVPAREHYQKAVTLDPQFIPALYNLAQMSLEAGDLTDATSRYEAILEIRPRSTEAKLGLVDVALNRRDVTGAVTILRKIIATDPEARAPYVRLIETLLNSGDNNNAARTAEMLNQRHYDTMEAFEMLGRVEAATGKQDLAMLNFRRARQAAGFSHDDLMRIARLQIEIEDFEGAQTSLEFAAQGDSSVVAIAALTRLEILRGSYEAATSRAQALIISNPRSAIGHTLIGEIRLARNEYALAVDSYRAAMNIHSGVEQVIGLSSAQYLGGAADTSIATLKTWLAEKSANPYVERELALRLIAMQNLAEAQTILERLTRAVGNDAFTLSTLARCYQLSKDPRARDTAQQAYELRPEWSVAAETLGWIMVTEGDTLEGLKLLRDAFARDKNPLTRFHIASALVELGRHSEAKDQLAVLMERGDQLPWISAVRDLYEQQP